MLLYFPKLPAKVCKCSFQITPLNREHCVLCRKKRTPHCLLFNRENLERGMAGLTETVLIFLTIVPLILISEVIQGYSIPQPLPSGTSKQLQKRFNRSLCIVRDVGHSKPPSCSGTGSTMGRRARNYHKGGWELACGSCHRPQQPQQWSCVGRFIFVALSCKQVKLYTVKYFRCVQS